MNVAELKAELAKVQSELAEAKKEAAGNVVNLADVGDALDRALKRKEKVARLGARTAELEAEIAAQSKAIVERSLAVAEVTRRGIPEPIHEQVAELNAKHAVIRNLGGKCLVMEWPPSVVFPGLSEISYETFQAFREGYMNEKVECDGYGRRLAKPVPLGQYWLGHWGDGNTKTSIWFRMGHRSCRGTF